MFYGAEIFSFPLHSMPEEQKVPKYDDIIGFLYLPHIIKKSKALMKWSKDLENILKYTCVCAYVCTFTVI